MRVKVLQYRYGDTPSFIYRRENPLQVAWKKFTSHMRCEKSTFMLENLYVCRIKSDLCLYPSGGEILTKILWYNDGGYVDPITGNKYIYDEEVRDYLNIVDKCFLVRNNGKLEDVKGVKERYPLFLSREQIENLNEILNKF